MHSSMDRALVLLEQSPKACAAMGRGELKRPKAIINFPAVLNVIRKHILLRFFGRIHVPNSNVLKMKLLNTYDDRDEAECAEQLLIGEKRLASERDATVVIYNLFGLPTWGNFHRLRMYRLDELQVLLEGRTAWLAKDKEKHEEILASLKTVAKNYGLEIPKHWM